MCGNVEELVDYINKHGEPKDFLTNDAKAQIEKFTDAKNELLDERHIIQGSVIHRQTGYQFMLHKKNKRPEGLIACLLLGKSEVWYHVKIEDDEEYYALIEDDLISQI